MLVTRNLQPSLWESVLPDEVRRLSPLLAQVDRWLDDEAFFVPFRPHFSPLLGRPSIPMEVYLRMMFLKFQYRLGYESLCREVSDSISWRIFCRLNLDDPVPAPSTLAKITTRCGEAAVRGLNEALLARADAAKLVKTGKFAPTPPWCRPTLSTPPTPACSLARLSRSARSSDGSRPLAGPPGPRFVTPPRPRRLWCTRSGRT